MHEQKAGRLPMLVALGVILLWGATPVATKLAAREIDPLVVGVARTLLGGVLGAPLALMLGIGLPRGRQIPSFALSAFCGFVGFPLLFTVGQRLTSAMHGGLVLAVLPIFTGLIAAAVERRRPPVKWWLGCLIAGAGEVLLALGHGATGGSGASLPGDLLVIISSLLASAGYVAGARLSQSHYPSLGSSLWGASTASIMLLPLLPVANGGWSPPAAGPIAWGAIAFLAWISSILGYVGWYWALARGGIARIGTIQFLQPLSGLVLAFFVLCERPSVTLVIAAILILWGVVVAGRR
jgi:drug/metabolite transporter (DMT)-like permease